jgi:hypothetical protein
LSVIAEVVFAYIARVIPQRCRDAREVGILAKLPVRIAEITAAEAPPVLHARMRLPIFRSSKAGNSDKVDAVLHGVEFLHTIPRAEMPCVWVQETTYRRGPDGALLAPVRQLAVRNGMGAPEYVTSTGLERQLAEFWSSPHHPHHEHPLLPFPRPEGGWLLESDPVRQKLGSDRALRFAAFQRMMASSAFVDGILHLPDRGPGFLHDSGRLVLKPVQGTGPKWFGLDRVGAALQAAQAECDAQVRRVGEQYRRKVSVEGLWEILDPDTVNRAAHDSLAEVVGVCRALVRENIARVGHWRHAVADAWFAVRDTLDSNQHAGLQAALGRLVEAAGDDLGKIQGGLQARKTLHRVAGGFQAAL